MPLSTTVGGLTDSIVKVIMTTLVVIIATALFTALWTPTIRPALAGLANDANTAARYGVGLTNSFFYIIDLVPVVWFFGAFVLIAATAYILLKHH